jgi:hypothetical protein
MTDSAAPACPDHAGRPLPPDADFFAPPPPEIGLLVSASTTLRVGVEPWSPTARLWLAGVLPLACGVVAAAATLLIEFGTFGRWWAIAGCLGVAVLVAATVNLMMLQDFSHYCRYVGRDGVARFACFKRRDNISRSEVLRFVDAADLWVAQVRIFIDGTYHANQFAFEWTGDGQRALFAIKGNSQVTGPAVRDLYQFAASAERVWTERLLDPARADLAAGRAVTFRLRRGGTVDLRRGVLRFDLSGKSEECPAAQLDEVTAANGVVTFARKDAREGWLWSKGVFRLPMNELANFELFLLLYAEAIGVRIQTARG